MGHLFFSFRYLIELFENSHFTGFEMLYMGEEFGSLACVPAAPGAALMKGSCLNLCLSFYSFFFFGFPGQYPVYFHKKAFAIGM